MISIPSGRGEALLGEHVDGSPTLAPHERIYLPVEGDVVKPSLANEGIVVSERDLGLRKHGSKLRIVPVDLKTATELVPNSPAHS